MAHGVWMNLGSAVIMPEVFVKAVTVGQQFRPQSRRPGHGQLDKQAQYRRASTCWSGPAAEGIELIGHHEMLLPLLALARGVPTGKACRSWTATAAA